MYIGAGIVKYTPQLACSWRISNDDSLPIHIRLTHVQLMNGDEVLIYDGRDSSATLLAAVTGTVLPNLCLYPH